jgi:D-inositol-3-phosphate glycosyltransferase
LKIAILSAHSSPLGTLGARDTGGMSTYVREVAVELAGLGHRVDVFTRYDGNGGATVTELAPGARLVHVEAGGHREIDKLALYDYVPEFAGNVARFAEAGGTSYDLVFSHYWLSGCIGSYLSFWWRVPHVVMFHTLGAVKNAVGVGWQEPELRVVNEATLVSSADRVIAATVLEKSQLTQYYEAAPGKVSVIPCGVNRARFQPGSRDSARRRLGLDEAGLILYVGRLEPLKGLDRVIRALPLIGGQTRLMVVGGDARGRAEEDRLKELASSLGVSGRIDFIGSVDHAALPDYYRAADVSVVPSHYESFGLVALESLASGTPVVAGDVGIMGRVIRDGENGYLLADTSTESLAARLDAVLGGEMTLATPETISATVADYGWDIVAASLDGECRGLLASTPALSV